MKTLNVYFLPKLAEADQISGSTCVVIDVLRATTTIAFALENGAKEVVPCLEIEDGRKVAASLAKDSYLWGGERGGTKIKGFDLGNSPAEYTAERVGGKSVFFTTTNGTRALLACAAADRVLSGAFANLSAVCTAVELDQKINLICAGTDGRITREDILVAGAMVDRLSQQDHYQLNDEAMISQACWQPIQHFDNKRLGQELLKSHGGANLSDLGMESDVLLSSVIDATTVVPVFTEGRITPRGAAV